MEITFGLLFILVAGFFQGTFILPMNMTKKWEWENSWFSFSFLGMIILNLLLAILFLPNLLSVYSSIATSDLFILAIFGFGWGIGAVLFGVGIARLGMALGYPIIMGLIACLGSLIPMMIFNPDQILSIKGILLMIAFIFVVTGIIFCAKAHVLKENSLKENSGGTKSSSVASDILIAVGAGILSCLPNVGMSFAGPLVDKAILLGASEFMAGNVVFALFFTMGFIPNAAYTIYLMVKNKSAKDFSFNLPKNLLMTFLMSLMWIGSFYIYGMSTSKLGSWGLIIGWPLFISLSIIFGDLWGLGRGEWKNAPKRAKNRLYLGLLIIFIAVILMGICNLK